MASETHTELLVADKPLYAKRVRGLHSEKHKRHLDTQIRNSRIHAPEGQMPLAVRGRDTEAGMLSGISRKRKIRSNLYWFTEFCNSQCLSHFAAPFIVVRAETSVAESCKQLFQWGSPPDDVTKVCRSTTIERFKVKLGNRSRAGRQSNSTLLPSSFQARASMLPKQPLHPRPEPHKRNAQWFIVWMRANDPSAGSPTETLLRLLLPLSDKVH